MSRIECTFFLSAYSMRFCLFLDCRSTFSKGLLSTPTFFPGSVQPILFNYYSHTQYNLQITSLFHRSMQPTLQPLPSLPIHSPHTSYPIFKATQFCKERPKGLPFGSSSSRSPPQLSPSQGCLLQSYQGIFSKQHSNTSNLRAPFGSLGHRFPQKNEKSPGPASYSTDKVALTRQEGARAVMGEASRMKPLQKEEGVGPGSYHLPPPVEKSQIRSKIKEKAHHTMEKYHLNKNSLRSSSESTPLFDVVDKENSSFNAEASFKKSPKKEDSSLNRFSLKNSTEKYLCSMQWPQVKVLDEPFQWKSHNYSPSFVAGRSNPYESYVKGSCSPGPAAYPRKHVKKGTGGAVSAFSSKVERTVFRVREQPKDKIKLSNCI